jgi:hypothetical protein
MTRSKGSEVAIETIRTKTARLKAAKEAFNSLVREVDLELEKKLSHIDEETVHVPLDLAQRCIQAVKKDRTLVQKVLKQLRQALEFRSISDESNGDEPHPSQSQLTTHNRASISAPLEPLDEEEEEEPEDDAGSLSGEDKLPNLGDIDLDDEEFIKQHEHREELDFESDGDVE